MEEYRNQEDDVLYISEASIDETAERKMKVFANILKYFGYGLGALSVLGGLFAWACGIVNFLAFLAVVCYAVFLVFMFIVSASFINVFTNISLSLKDITKLLNR